MRKESTNYIGTLSSKLEQNRAVLQQSIVFRLYDISTQLSKNIKIVAETQPFPSSR